jgi:hypothetical protein
MLFVLRYLDRLILDDQHNGLSNHLATVLIETSATMERFGKFKSTTLTYSDQFVGDLAE